jgi:hypothetical protein
MSEIKDGGPAFPMSAHVKTPGGHETVQISGMTLRDYFAAQAMNAFVRGEGSLHYPTVQEGLAKRSYQIADAMLRAREVQP